MATVLFLMIILFTDRGDIRRRLDIKGWGLFGGLLRSSVSRYSEFRRESGRGKKISAAQGKKIQNDTTRAERLVFNQYRIN
jgi:hypothetical protein